MHENHCGDRARPDGHRQGSWQCPLPRADGDVRLLIGGGTRIGRWSVRDGLHRGAEGQSSDEIRGVHGDVHVERRPFERARDDDHGEHAAWHDRRGDLTLERAGLRGEALPRRTQPLERHRGLHLRRERLEGLGVLTARHQVDERTGARLRALGHVLRHYLRTKGECEDARRQNTLHQRCDSSANRHLHREPFHFECYRASVKVPSTGALQT